MCVYGFWRDENLTLSSVHVLLAYKTTIRLIPIAADGLKRNMYGLDINKKGTKMGEIAIPEALGLGGCGARGAGCRKDFTRAHFERKETRETGKHGERNTTPRWRRSGSCCFLDL